MATPSLLDRAKTGDADAIAALLTQILNPQSIIVRGERQTFCLTLWLDCRVLPDQREIVSIIRRQVAQLQVAAIGIVQIHCRVVEQPDLDWFEEVSLLGLEGDAAVPLAEPGPISLGTAARTDQHNSVVPAALAQAYDTLQLKLTATLPEVDAAYFGLRAERLRQGRRAAIAPLKEAHAMVKIYLQSNPGLPPATPPSTAPSDLLEDWSERLRSHGLEGRARIHNGQLQIRLEPVSAQRPNRAMATLHTLLTQIDYIGLGLHQGSTVVVYGLASPQKIGWKRQLPLPLSPPADHTDLMSFQNPYVITFGFPVLLLLGIVMNAVPLTNYLLFGIKIWFHEFGHATVAWLGGRRAIPLPFGWTNVDEQRSLFVYLGVLVLLGLMAWAGRREQQRWPVVLAGVLVVLQFWITWLLPPGQFETWLAFGGIGGEFYLCTLLMVSFFFPLPQYWRWDFYRYPVVLGAAFTFWGQFWLWRQIRRGLESIPWGSMWGGPDHGDMNNLSYAGWSDQQIIDTYSTLGTLCLLILVGIYSYFAIQQNRHFIINRWWR